MLIFFVHSSIFIHIPWHQVHSFSFHISEQFFLFLSGSSVTPTLPKCFFTSLCETTQQELTHTDTYTQNIHTYSRTHARTFPRTETKHAAVVLSCEKRSWRSSCAPCRRRSRSCGWTARKPQPWSGAMMWIRSRGLTLTRRWLRTTAAVSS